MMNYKKEPLIFSAAIAGCVFSIQVQHESTKLFCKSYFTDREPEFSVSVSQADIDYEREKNAREEVVEGIPHREYSDAYLETLALYRKIVNALLDRDILLFHGSAIGVDGVCYLFTAKSGTGKSTHTRLWRQLLGQRAVMINDDKPLLHIGADGVTVYGTPWNGKHGLGTNTSAPLKAVCILRRGEENEIRPITPAQALPMVLQQTLRPQGAAAMTQYLDLVDRLTANTRFWELHCNMDPSAAEVSCRAMSQERNE